MLTRRKFHYCALGFDGQHKKATIPTAASARPGPNIIQATAPAMALPPAICGTLNPFSFDCASDCAAEIGED